MAGLSPYEGIPIVVVVAFAVGVAIYWIAVDRVIGRPILMSLLATFACNMILIGIGTALWTTSPYNIPVSLPGISWQGYTFTGTHMMAAVFAGLIAGLLYLFLNHARYGKAIRAVASNREAAELSGIPTKQVLAVTFGLGVALACAAGALIATLFPFTVLSGSNYQLKSFVVTVLGGLGNPAGALAGRHRARPGRGTGDAVHAGELDADHRVRAVRRRAGGVSARHFRAVARLTHSRRSGPRRMTVSADIGTTRTRPAQDRRLAAPRRLFPGLIILLGLLFAIVPYWSDDVGLRESFLLAAVYITLASNLNVMIGYTGYINFGNIVFFGLGGYICVDLVTRLALAAGGGGAGGRRRGQPAGAGVRLRHPAPARRVLRARHHRGQRGGAPVRRQFRAVGRRHRHLSLVRCL